MRRTLAIIHILIALVLTLPAHTWAATTATTKFSQIETGDIITKGPWVDVRAFASLSAAVASPHTAGKLILVARAESVSDNLTIPADRAIEVAPGGSLDVAAGKTLTINGPFESGDYRCFAGDGAVAGLREALPEWFAVNTNPGTTDMSGALTKAIAAVSGSAVHVGTVLLHGRYGVASPVDGSGKHNYTIQGAKAGTPYGGAEVANAYAGAVLVPVAGWPADTPVLNMRQSKNSHIYDVAILMAKDGNGYGIALGNTSGIDTYPNHNIEHCVIYGGQRGISSRYGGLLHVLNNNISNQSEQGIYLYTSGDSTLAGNNIQSVNVNYTGDDYTIGAGIFLDQYGGKCNISGGNIEHNSKGIVLRRSQFTTITGVEFDVNRYFHIGVLSAGIDDNVHGTAITGNTFISGGSRETSTGIGNAAVMIASVGAAGVPSRLTGAITGNTFIKADEMQNPAGASGEVGPVTAGVRFLNINQGDVDYSVTGNNMMGASAGYKIHATGPGASSTISILESGNQSGLSNYTSGTSVHISTYAQSPTWASQAFNAADFSAPAGVWTVESGDVGLYRYTVVGKIMTVSFVINTSTVSATPTYLTLKVPGGYTVASQAENYYGVGITANNGTTTAARVTVLQGGTGIRIYKGINTTDTYSAETDLTSVRGTITFEVQ